MLCATFLFCRLNAPKAAQPEQQEKEEQEEEGERSQILTNIHHHKRHEKIVRLLLQITSRSMPSCIDTLLRHLLLLLPLPLLFITIASSKKLERVQWDMRLHVFPACIIGAGGAYSADAARVLHLLRETVKGLTRTRK